MYIYIYITVTFGKCACPSSAYNQKCTAASWWTTPNAWRVVHLYCAGRRCHGDSWDWKDEW